MPRTNEELRTLVASLSLEEKIQLLSGAGMFVLAGNSGIDLSPIVLSDGPTGVRGEVVVGGRQACLLPNASSIAQSWNRALLAEVGDILAEEARLQHTHVVLGPTINLHRSPLGGRVFEAFSEDPLLTGHLAAAYIRGLQRHRIGASVKHFLGNESETERTTVDSVIDDATLREVYLAPFEVALQDAEPWTLMAAYNRVNGVASTEHDELLNGVVKDEWEYDGVIMSDWYATSRTRESVTGGLDLVMPGPSTPWSESLAADVHSGAVPESVIDDHVRRVLRLGDRVGALGQPRDWDDDNLPAPVDEVRREQLRRIAASGMVVLKNDDQLLPLAPDAPDSILVTGRHAHDTIAQGGGSAQVRPPHVVSIESGLRSALGDHRITVLDGVETRVTLPVIDAGLVANPVNGRPGMRVRVFDAQGAVLHDRHSHVAEIEDNKTDWLEHAASIEFSATLNVPAGEYQLGVRGPGSWEVRAPGHVEHFEIPFHPGPGGGFFRPKSHASTVHFEAGATVVATVSKADKARILGLVLSNPARPPAQAIAAAAKEAQRSDLAIVVVGLTPDEETEGQDKQTLALPGHQDALVTAVAAAALRTIVVVNAATPVLMPWIDDVDAVLIAGLPGQEAGDAVAAALTGTVLPEGRLVTTYPAHDGEGPAWNTRPHDGRLEYQEGGFVGYRGWHRLPEVPAFWFGQGLGLTSWEYGEPVVAGADDLGVRNVRIDVRNTGALPGRETVQVYLEPDDDRLPTRLIGWGSAELAPGQTISVSVECDVRFQRRWMSSTRSWAPITGGRLVIARGLGDVRASLPIGSTATSRSAPDPAISVRTEV